MITVHTVAYNESLLIQFMIDHYRKRFPGCRIIVYDNMSTDNTVKIALANNCGKDAKTDWVLMCDLDELLDINEVELKTEEGFGTSMIRCEFYDMINMEDNLDIAGMKYGEKSPLPGKFLLFNKKLINEINYTPGAHGCNPMGTVIYSNKVYKAYHYNAINENVTIEKFKDYSARLSPDNIKHGWSLFVLSTPEQIREEYVAVRSKAIKVR